MYNQGRRDLYTILFEKEVISVAELGEKSSVIENQENRDNTYSTLKHWQNFKVRLIVEGIGVGVATGLVVVLYRFLLDLVGSRVGDFINYQREHPMWIIAGAVLLFIVAKSVKWLMEMEPLIKGSGIPQVEGYLLRQIDLPWYRVLVAKFVGGLMSIGAGLSLGREGPSIQLGAAIGKGASKIFKCKKIETKFLITGGASAGLAAAFNAPLAGVMFALEELHKNFSPVVLLTALVSAVCGDFVSKQFFGTHPVFDFSGLEQLPLKYYMYVLFLGAIVGVFGAIYNKTLIKTQKWYGKMNTKFSRYKFYIPFALAGILAFVLPEILRGGHHLVEGMVKWQFGIKMLIVLLVAKFIFSMLSYGSGAPGGIFLPLLVIGAITGTLFGQVLVTYGLLPEQYVQNMVILAMAAYFTAIVRAPITGCLLISEMTGSFQHFLAIAMACVVAYLIADAFKTEPIYESLLDQLLKNRGLTFKASSRIKSLIETTVRLGSSLDGSRVKDVKWPCDALIVGIQRGHKEIIPNGKTEILAGDCLIALTNEDAATCVQIGLSKLAEDCQKVASKEWQ